MDSKLFFGFISLTLAASITAKTVPSIISLGHKFDLVDEPNARKQHERRMVRIGGISIFLGLISTLFFLYFIPGDISSFDINLSKPILATLITGFIFFLVGLLDDFFSLSPFLRLGIQFIVTFFAWSEGLRIQLIDISMLNLNISELYLPNIFSILITGFWLVGIANAINWMDGLDGLAAGILFINTLGISLISYSYANSFIFLFSLTLVGTSLGFLRYNFYPSKIHMGDSGSYLYGSLLGCLSILTFTKFNLDFNYGVISFEKSIFLVLIPILDMTFVIAKRLLERKSPFFPDRSHLHHRILDSGRNTRQAVLNVYFLVILTTLVTYIIA